MKKRKLPRLSRGWEILRNLTVAVLSLVLFWGINDYPLPDPVDDFRRAEHCCWVGPSDIQYIGEHYGTVGTYLDQVVIENGKNFLTYWPRNPEGPTLVPMYPNSNAFVAVDVPEGTVRAELTLELSFYYFPSMSTSYYVGPTYASQERAKEDWGSGSVLWQDTYVFQGEFLKEGGVLFRAEPKSPEVPGELGVWDGLPLLEVTDRDIYVQDPRDNSAWAHMAAVFYGENGVELGRAVLDTPSYTNAG